jgi:hypothetical protein
MSNTTRGVFIFLLAFSLVAVALLFDGVARMKRNEAPPFNEGLVTSVDMLPRPPGAVLLQLDKPAWKVGLWIFAIALPVVSGVFAFRMERSVLAFALLIVWATATGIFGIWVWLYSAFHNFKL